MRRECSLTGGCKSSLEICKSDSVGGYRVEGKSSSRRHIAKQRKLEKKLETARRKLLASEERRNLIEDKKKAREHEKKQRKLMVIYLFLSFTSTLHDFIFISQSSPLDIYALEHYTRSVIQGIFLPTSRF
jgi:hypothetical protein